MNRQLWQLRRGALNHDWLQNQFGQLLASGLAFLRGDFEEEGFAERFTKKLVSQWSDHRGEAARLAADFEVEMSPRIYLERFPLSRLSAETRGWLGTLVHACWLTRADVPRLVDSVLRADADAQRAFTALERHLFAREIPPSAAQLALARPELEELARCCHALSVAISQLPNRMESA